MIFVFHVILVRINPCCNYCSATQNNEYADPKWCGSRYVDIRLASFSEYVDQILIGCHYGRVHLYQVLLDCQEIAIVVWLVSGQVDEIITEVAVQLNAKPVMIGSIVVNEELRSHLRVKEGAEDWIFLAFHARHELSAIGRGHRRH